MERRKGDRPGQLSSGTRPQAGPEAYTNKGTITLCPLQALVHRSDLIQHSREIGSLLLWPLPSLKVHFESLFKHSKHLQLIQPISRQLQPNNPNPPLIQRRPQAVLIQSTLSGGCNCSNSSFTIGLLFFNTSQLLLLQLLEVLHLVQLLQSQPPREKWKLSAPIER